MAGKTPAPSTKPRKGHRKAKRGRKNHAPERPSSAHIAPIGAFIAPVGALTAAALVFLVFLPTLGNEFVYWDDNLAITENPFIRSLDASLLKWAFTSNLLLSWIPLTFISFGVDYALWGPEPWGFHLTNNLLHSANTFIVFFLVFRLVVLARPEVGRSGLNKRALGAAFVTALLFGLHPMRVESVAWATERKDVLYALFYLLAVLAYLGYVSRNSKKVWRYAGVLALFACSLMSKPMAVTLPAVLLVLDYYPLRRLGNGSGPSRPDRPSQPGRPSRPGRWRGAFKPVVEKAPLFAMSLFASLAALRANVREGELFGKNSPELLQTETILLNVRSYVFSLYKMLVPLDLVPIYPRPKIIGLFTLEFALYTLVFSAITLYAVLSVKKRRFFSAAWFYYLIALLPVLPILSVGNRFTYLPCLGPFILVGLLAGGALAGDAGRRRRILAAGVVLFTAALLATLSVKQIGLWKDSMTLWTYQITRYPGRISFAYSNRGNAHYRAEDFKDAIKDYTRAIEIKPGFAHAYYNRANTLARLGEFKEAVEDYTSAIKLNPALKDAYMNRGNSFMVLGELNRAIRDYTAAIGLDPSSPSSVETYINRASAHMRLGEVREAIGDYTRAIALDPGFVRSYRGRAGAHEALGNLVEAKKDLARARELEGSIKMKTPARR